MVVQLFYSWFLPFLNNGSFSFVDFVIRLLYNIFFYHRLFILQGRLHNINHLTWLLICK